VTEPELAVIVTDPVAKVLRRPPLTVAVAVSDDVHDTVPVTSWLVPSLNCPLALSCFVKPSARDTVAGLTVMEVRVTFGGDDCIPPHPLRVHKPISTARIGGFRRKYSVP
jgi:hypothetical protein